MVTQKRKVRIILLQLGSPSSPKISHVREYLREFLGDPRVVDINPFLWKIILHLFILPFRPQKSAKLYSRIWNEKEKSFPLVSLTEKFAEGVSRSLASSSEGHEEDIEVSHAFLLSPPRLRDLWAHWEREFKENPSRSERFLLVPLFPQYSESTTASCVDAFGGEFKGRVFIPSFEAITSFHRAKCFIDHSARQMMTFLQRFQKENGGTDALILSFHGMPKRRIREKKDPYFLHCYETFHLIKRRLEEMAQESSEKILPEIYMTFQSRFGSEQWLTPYTDEFCRELVSKGKKKLAISCPAFVTDCLETLDEIGTELSSEVASCGGEVQFIPCLNAHEKWCEDFATFLYHHSQSSRKDIQKQYYELEEKDYEKMPEVVMTESGPSPKAKKTLKIIFLTLFLDLIGFSIIFPLFPALAKYYLSTDGDNIFLRALFGSLSSLTSLGGSDMSTIVLFGGGIGALYSFLQFLSAPLWGSLSDRIGRRPVLLLSLSFLGVSYLLWFFSGSFTVFLLSRIIGGIMGGNISTATAVAADVTSKKNRSWAMAIIGVAFAFGFIIGPAMGGIFSLLDLGKLMPFLVPYGVNPFSGPAAFAFLLCLINLIWVYRRFEETLPPEKRGEKRRKKRSGRSINPLILFKPLPYKGINLTNFGNFFFLTIFSGMEFTLTFLAAERLGYSSLDNASMFIFIGFLIALTQGGYVRRRAHSVGEKKMALRGLFMLIPGLLAIGLAHSSWPLYFGLFFLAIGSSMTTPCLTSLVSLYTPAEFQGQSVGIFRSLGALARVFGPLLSSLLYWKWGSSSPYFLGALLLGIPLAMVMSLPHPEGEEEGEKL